MALADAWWMQKSSRSQAPLNSVVAPGAPHLAWPWSESSGTSLSYHELEQYLQQQRGRQCSIDKYRYVMGSSSRGAALWKHSQTVRTTEDLVKMLKEPVRTRNELLFE